MMQKTLIGYGFLGSLFIVGSLHASDAEDKDDGRRDVKWGVVKVAVAVIGVVADGKVDVNDLVWALPAIDGAEQIDRGLAKINRTDKK